MLEQLLSSITHSLNRSVAPTLQPTSALCRGQPSRTVKWRKWVNFKKFQVNKLDRPSRTLPPTHRPESQQPSLPTIPSIGGAVRRPPPQSMLLTVACILRDRWWSVGGGGWERAPHLGLVRSWLVMQCELFSLLYG